MLFLRGPDVDHFFTNDAIHCRTKALRDSPASFAAASTCAFSSCEHCTDQ
jgi:hypothetical protein